MSDGDLIRHFLNLDLLERPESRCSSLHVQRASNVVGLTLLRRAGREWGEGLLSDLLEDFVTARIACVGIYEQEGLDFRDARDDTPDSDEFAEMGTLDRSDGQDLVSARRLEVDVASCESA